MRAFCFAAMAAIALGSAPPSAHAENQGFVLRPIPTDQGLIGTKPQGAKVDNPLPSVHPHAGILTAEAATPDLTPLDLSDRELDTSIYLVQYAGGDYFEWLSLRSFLTKISRHPKFRSFERRYIHGLSDTGIGIHFRGTPLLNVFLRNDGGEYYLSYFGAGDDVDSVAAPMAQQQVGLALRNLLGAK